MLRQVQDRHTLIPVALPMPTVGVSRPLPLLERSWPFFKHTWNVSATPHWNHVSITPAKEVTAPVLEG